MDTTCNQMLDQFVGAVLGAGEYQHLRQLRVLDQMGKQTDACGRGRPDALFASITSAVELRRATSIIAGVFSKPSASALISSEKVAENSRFWRLCGSAASMLRISRMKPMSSMRSASSSTRISTCDKIERALLHMIEQAARGGDQDIDAAVSAA